MLGENVQLRMIEPYAKLHLLILIVIVNTYMIMRHVYIAGKYSSDRALTHIQIILENIIKLIVLMLKWR